MNKQILLISTSFRKGSNSEKLADEFTRGAIEAGNEIEKINLYNKKMEFCRGCLICQNSNKCIINDDICEVLEKVKLADILVFSTPIYYYEMSGQMKTFLDRTNPLFSAEYNFKKIYLIATSADEDKNSIDGVKKGLEGWISCFEKASMEAIVHAGGVDKIGDILKYKDVMQHAYELGHAIK